MEIVSPQLHPSKALRNGCPLSPFSQNVKPLLSDSDILEVSSDFSSGLLLGLVSSSDLLPCLALLTRLVKTPINEGKDGVAARSEAGFAYWAQLK